MLMPSIFGENLFDDFMDFPFDDKWEKRGTRSSSAGKTRFMAKMRPAL